MILYWGIFLNPPYSNSYIYKIGTAFKCDSGRQNWASLHYSHLVSGTIKYQAVQLGAEVTGFLPTIVNLEENG